MSASWRTGIDAALQLGRRRRAASGAVVLGYHDIVPTPSENPWSVTARSLGAHIRVLRRLGTQIVPLSEIVDRLEAGTSVDGLAALTFDDALVGVYRYGADVLSDAAAPATIFVVSGTLGDRPPWWAEADRTMRPDELTELESAGLSLAAHTRSHRSLPTLDDTELTEELDGCRRDLHELAARPIDLLAYPSGHFDDRVVDAAANSGFRAAFTFLNGRIEGSEDRFRLPRLTMGSHSHVPRLAYHVLRHSASWPDHQLESVRGDD